METRDRIVEVLAKYNIALPDAPLDALTMAMERMNQSLLRPVSIAKMPDMTTPEGVARSRKAADYYNSLKEPKTI